jgi:epoxyqueuosine reductase
MHDADSLVELAANLEPWARELGFSHIGIAQARVEKAAAARLRAWLAKGWHGDMDYMARHAALRVHPESLTADAVTVITASLDYWPQAGFSAARSTLEDPGRAYISRYALGRDYHKIMRRRLAALVKRMEKVIGSFGYRVFSDSAPVMEVEFAGKSGLGWRGKHTLSVSRQGSLRFLGEIYTDLPLPTSQETRNHCGRCDACLKVCPTRAIVAPYQLDARRCISYLTIELTGSIPEPLRPLIGNRVYGCDDCQLCCPWNRFARVGDPEFSPRHGLETATLVELFHWEAADFNARLAGSPIRRIGFERWLRNLAVALGNAPATPATRAALQKRANHASSLVREHVTWALAHSGLRDPERQCQKADPSSDKRVANRKAGKYGAMD